MRLRIFILSCLLFIVAGCSTDDPTRHNTFIPLTAMEVSGTYQTMASQTVNQYRAVGDFSGTFTRDITTEVSWSIEDSTIATVSNETGSQGLVTALAPGETSVIAFYGDFSQSAPVFVTDSIPTGIEITPQDASLHVGVSQQYDANGIFSDNSTQDVTTLANWESTAPDIATINNTGLAATIAAGTTTISATWQGITADTSLLVTGAALSSITVTPQADSIHQNTTLQFTAEGMFSDGSTQDITASVDWQSSATNVAIIDADGLATGIGPGETEIRATHDGDSSVITATAALTVSDAVINTIRVTPENSIIVIGTSQQFTAIAYYSDNTQQDITDLADWQSTNEAVGTISSSAASRGLFTSIDFGTTFVVASFGGVSGQAPLRVQ
jgi:hypothetical protein